MTEYHIVYIDHTIDKVVERITRDFDHMCFLISEIGECEYYSFVRVERNYD